MADHPALQLLCRREVPVFGNVLVVHVRVRSDFGGPSDAQEIMPDRRNTSDDVFQCMDAKRRGRKPGHLPFFAISVSI